MRLVNDHLGEYQNVTAASVAVAKQLGVSRESVRRWVAQAGVDSGERPGITSSELEEIKRLKAENRRLREDVAIYFCDPRSPWQRGTNENTVSV